MSRENIVRVKTLADAFDANTAGEVPEKGKLCFAGVGDRDVYNISAPFHSAGRRVIAGRVEARDSEDSIAVFFDEADEIWYPIKRAPHFRLQDPFVTEIAGKLVFGGVEVDLRPAQPIWHTVFYHGTDVFDLVPFFAGPIGMKDIRLCELTDGRIAIFTRPRGTKGGRGTIGYTEVATLGDMTIAAIDAAPMLENMFHPLDWGGANEAHLLASGEIGVIAHAAFFEQDILYGTRRYYAAAFVFDPARHSWRNYRLIASRDQFIPGPAKRPDLVDVVFSSGIEQAGGATRLYAGTSDAEAQWVNIPFPFDVPLAKPSSSTTVSSLSSLPG